MFKRFVTIMLVSLILCGCASTGTSLKKIPPDSKFSKLKISMTKQNVYNLIGPPEDVSSQVPVKVFMPFYFGTDNDHTVLYYEGEGRIEFNSKDVLIKIIYDPKEDGSK